MTSTPRWAVVALGALFAASCGGSDEGQRAAPPNDTEAAEVAADDTGGVDQAASAVPDVLVVDIPTGDPTELRSLVDPDRPTLLWMWAPH